MIDVGPLPHQRRNSFLFGAATTKSTAKKMPTAVQMMVDSESERLQAIHFE